MDDEKVELYSISGFMLQYRDIERASPFGGFFFTQGNPNGALVDNNGTSTLRLIEFDKEILVFDKTYDNRRDTITYNLRRNGDIWEGKFDGRLTLCGGVIANVSQGDYYLKKLEEIAERETNLQNITQSMIESFVDDGMIDSLGENGYKINPPEELGGEDLGYENDLPF